MKFLKKAFCLVMVLVIMVSAVVFPVSASETINVHGAVCNEFLSFPVLRRNSSNTEYVKFLQRFLCVLPTTHELIYNTDNTYHGVDGGFGWVTEEAVLVFQTAFLGQDEADGIVGINTWRAISECLVSYPGDIDGERYFYSDIDTSVVEDTVVIRAYPIGNRYNLYTFRANATIFPNSFHNFTLPS